MLVISLFTHVVTSRNISFSCLVSHTEADLSVAVLFGAALLQLRPLLHSDLIGVLHSVKLVFPPNVTSCFQSPNSHLVQRQDTIFISFLMCLKSFFFNPQILSIHLSHPLCFR